MTGPSNDALAFGLSGSLRDFRVPGGRDLLARGDGFFRWQDARRSSGLWPYARANAAGPLTHGTVADDSGRLIEGVNFGSQDYLSLSSHLRIKAAAVEALSRFGVHSAGSGALAGNTAISVRLEHKIAEFLRVEDVALYPTGFAAGYGVIKGLVRSADHIVIDMLAHACLHEGANAATQNISVFRHLDTAHCRSKLKAIRAKDSVNAILVITEGLFSMDSDSPDIAAMQELCSEYGATLMVDVAHDFGCLGADGRGQIGVQNMVGKIDIVMGSFSKTFASNGGFVATRSRALKEYLRYYSPPSTFSNALSPVQAAVVLEAFAIIESAEGAERREQLMANILLLRALFASQGIEVYGDPSAIVCAKVGAEDVARLTSRRLPGMGLLTNLVEYPAVARDAARFRLQVMADHRAADVIHAVRCMTLALDAAQSEADELRGPAKARSFAA